MGHSLHYWIFFRADVTQKKYTDVTQNFPRNICVFFLCNICAKQKCPPDHAEFNHNRVTFQPCNNSNPIIFIPA